MKIVLILLTYLGCCLALLPSIPVMKRNHLSLNVHKSLMKQKMESPNAQSMYSVNIFGSLNVTNEYFAVVGMFFLVVIRKMFENINSLFVLNTLLMRKFYEIKYECCLEFK
jgi:hypothetical protein